MLWGGGGGMCDVNRFSGCGEDVVNLVVKRYLLCERKHAAKKCSLRKEAILERGK